MLIALAAMAVVSLMAIAAAFWLLDEFLRVRRLNRILGMALTLAVTDLNRLTEVQPDEPVNTTSSEALH